MDERLKKALDFSNYMVTLNNKKRVLQEQYEQECVHYYAGGQFSVTQQLISFCQSLVNLDQETAVLIDDNNQPIEIDPLEEFLKDILSVYSTASNRYLVEYNKIKNDRSLEGLLEL